MFAAPLLLGLVSVPAGDALTVRDLAPLTRLDAAVRALPVPASRTVAIVAKALATVAHTPLERARAAYDWTTMHVAYSLDRQDATGVLQELRGDCEAHATLYTALGKALGLECAIVSGRVRFAVPPEAALAGDTKPLAKGQWLVGHAWNAVRIDGRWGLVDTTMGAKADKSGIAVDDYFLPDPGVVATDHVPDDARWALAPVPAALAKVPIVRPHAWRLGIERGELELRGGVMPLVWRKGLRASLQTATGSVPDRALAQPAVDPPKGGTELRLRPTGGASIVWLGLTSEGGWQPLAGYPVAEPESGRLPRLMKDFYDSEAVLEGPFERDLVAGRLTEIRLRAPGATSVVAFQGPALAGRFVREGEFWTLRATPEAGAALEIMASYADPGRFQGLLAYDVR